MTTIVRPQVAHTPRNPLLDEGALQAFSDGAVAFAGGRILAVGSWEDVRRHGAEADVVDATDAVVRVAGKVVWPHGSEE